MDIFWKHTLQNKFQRMQRSKCILTSIKTEILVPMGVVIVKHDVL